ncbi:MAG: DUF502 domain-containing protein [Candidatus Omnitrophica bacterium]|nr:DUF502 domain-containing protein [Candidatus Omnitrophota bacterium]
MAKKFRHYLGSGLLVLAPLFFTVLVIGYLIRLTDHFVVNPVFRVLPIEFEAGFKIFLTKIVIALLVLFFVAAVGAAAERFIFRNLVSGFEAFLSGIPIFNRVYASIKEIAQAFFGDKSGVFKSVVFLEYPRKGLWAMGFVTQEKKWALHDLIQKDVVSVFVPSPPNPATGFFIFVPREELIESGVTVEEGIRLVISGGAAVPAPRA